MAKAKKLQSGSWRAQAFSHFETVDGVKKPRYRSFTAPTRAEAERMAAEFRAGKDRRERGRLTVGEAVDGYIDSKSAVLSPSTLRSYRVNRKNHLGMLEGVLVQDVSSADLQAYVNALAASVSPKTVRNVYNMVLAAIRVHSDRTYRVTLPAKSVMELHVPDDAQVAALLAAAPEGLKLCILLASVGTLRRGEICGLKHKDVLRDFSAVYVHTDVVRGPDGAWVHKEMPKNASSVRRVVLPAEVMEMIGDGDPEERVYKGTPGSITDSFARLRDRLGLKCRFHDLRHYAASILHAIGVPDQYIMERGGWATDGTLKAVYRNTLSDKSKTFTEKANEYFSQKLLPSAGKKDA